MTEGEVEPFGREGEGFTRVEWKGERVHMGRRKGEWVWDGRRIDVGWKEERRIN